MICAVLGIASGPFTSIAAGWQQETGCRWAELNVPRAGSTGFTLLSPAQTGIDFTNVLLEFSGATNRILHNGAGLALGDFDRDGLVDIFACGLDSPSALYRNLGQWRFANVTAASGLTFPGPYQRGAVFADINADASLDLLVSTLNQGVLCFLNDGQSRFTNVTASAGTASPYGSVTMALADVDGNGTLDLYVADNRAEDIRNRGVVNVFMRNGQYVIPPQLKDRLVVVNGVVREYGEPDFLYLNDGQGRFSPVSWTNGAFLDEQGRRLQRPPLDWGQTVVLRDLNGDGSPDIYVCNDYWTADRIWINDGRGRFRAIDPFAIRHLCFSSMGVDVADINRDGCMDVLVTDMLSRDRRLRKRQVFAFNPMAPPVDPMAPLPDMVADRPQMMHNTLLLNRGDHTFADIANYAGLASSDWAWQQVFLDVDLDGFEDLLISAGYFRDVQDRDAIVEMASRPTPQRGFTNEADRQLAFNLQKMANARLYPVYELPVIAFRNRGDLTFEEVTTRWGTDQPGIRQGIATGDLDGDGDLDFAVNSFNGPLGVYRNNASQGRVAVRLKGQGANVDGIGSLVSLLGGAIPRQSQEVICGGRYLSGSEALLVFATGPAQDGMTFEVAWRSGRKSVIGNVKAGRIYEIDESGATTPTPTPAAKTSQLFADASPALGHTHHELPFDDFARQPLLPRKLSQPGPGLAWWDVDGDGHEDLVIGSGKGGTLGIYLGDGRGGFARVTNALTSAVTARDQTGVVCWKPEGQPSAVLSGMANYEDGQAQGAAVNEYQWTSNQIREAAGADDSSVGPLALGDMDGDGDLDLYVGGRVVAGRWPEAASSRLYRFESGRFVLDEKSSKALEQIGLVSGAVWTDLSGDGFAELVLACEWGPVRILYNNRGEIKAQDYPVVMGREPAGQLSQWTGWWNGVSAGDLDGDGRMDLIAANWGLNSPYAASMEHPQEVYYGDLVGLGSVEVVEAEYSPELDAVAPRRFRDPLMACLPFVAGGFPTHKAYSEASLEAVLGEARSRARLLQARTLASTVFLNRENYFEAVRMPAEAQFAPAFGVVVNDLNGDGAEDVFLSQNFFANQPEMARLDAGRGLVLLGNGRGELEAMGDSGIAVYGDQRGAAAGDYDEDGRVDLVVSQNGARTCLWHNTGAAPGLRVRLSGPAGNPMGIGAVLRLKQGDGYGPARELHAGSGYLSQDSAVAILASRASPTALWIRWPGGKLTEVDLPAGTPEVRVSLAGRVSR